jgi:hypothetical protein
LPEKTFQYKEQESLIFGRVRRPLIDLDIYSTARNKWIPLYKVLVDTGADISVLPRNVGELLVDDITSGTRVEIRGVVPYSLLICYVHELMLKINDEKEFRLPVALADSDDVPIILGRVDGIDLFDARFLNGNEIRLGWKE